MIHLGDITQIRGDKILIVDIITGGSPCQDLSVAGKRAGLDGERSGLFMEQIRIVKEMRERDRRTGRSAWLIRPRFMVWENVPGAFSSNKGRDFQAVLSEIVKIAEPDAPDVPMPEGGRWSKSGCLYSDMGDWSVAWRVHDAQFWGVPQRRKRIALAADFGGLAAPEVLFERAGVSGDPEPRGEKGEGTAAATGGGVEGASVGFTNRGYASGDVAETLRSDPHGAYPMIAHSAEPILLESNQNHATIQTDGISTALPASAGMGGGAVTAGFKAGQSKDGGLGYEEEKAPTLSATPSALEPTVVCLNDQGGSVMGVSEEVTGALRAQEHGNQPLIASAGFSFGQSAKARSIGYEEEVSPTLRGGEGGNQKPCVLDATSAVDVYNGTVDGDISATLTAASDGSNHSGPKVMATAISGGISMLVTGCYQNTGQGWWNQSNVGATLRTPCGGDSVKANLVTSLNSIVRRLTPLECERLQGFPDGWTDIGEWTDSKGRLHKEADSPRYKALGNSIALPFWEYLARRICALYERPATMGSLFDGIGGFPLAFERAGAKAIWASEIEEFPIAVTKLHFPEERRTNAR